MSSISKKSLKRFRISFNKSKAKHPKLTMDSSGTKDSTTITIGQDSLCESSQNDSKLSDTDQAPEKNIFVEMEPSTNNHLLVTDQPKTHQKVTDHATQSKLQTETKLDPEQAHVLLSPSDHSSSTDLDEPTTLPATLTRLTTANGAEVFLIGTAHFSLKSVQDVQTVMRTIKPSVVVLELCRERAFMLTMDERALLEENKTLSFAAIRNAIAEKGLAQGLIFTMFIKMSASLTEKLGLAPGSEFRAGAAEASKLPNCGVVLGDRSLRTTVARAVASVNLWQKMKLILQLLVNDVSITQEDVEKCKDKDMLEQMLRELGGEFPGFKKVLLDERNYYLAHTIYHSAQNSITSLGPQRVVAIVGIGHVGGIVENWGKTTLQGLKEIDEMPTTSKTQRVVSKAIKYGSIALLIYVGYKTFFPRQ